MVEHDIPHQPTDAAVELLAELGYDREYGARPLKRIIQQKVEDALSDALLGGEVEDGDLVILDIEMGEDAPDIIIKRGESEEEELGTPA